jgi:hypothetical protein
MTGKAPLPAARLPGEGMSAIVAALWRSLLWEMLDFYRPRRHDMRRPAPQYAERSYLA